MPTQVAVQRGVTRIGGKPRLEEGASGVGIALFVIEVGAGVRRPRVLRVLGEGSIDLWAGGIVLSVLRERHAVMGGEPPIVAVARGKPVQQVQERAFLPGAAGTANQAVGERGGAE